MQAASSNYAKLIFFPKALGKRKVISRSCTLFEKEKGHQIIAKKATLFEVIFSALIKIQVS